MAELERPDSLGALAELAGQGNEAARAAVAAGRRYASDRIAELQIVHGELSKGVRVQIQGAGELLGLARYWGALALGGDPDSAKLCGILQAHFRSAEKDVWKQAERENAARTVDAGVLVKVPAKRATGWKRPKKGR